MNFLLLSGTHVNIKRAQEGHCFMGEGGGQWAG